MQLPYGKKKRQKIRITTPDNWFSKFIRLRDIFDGEYCRCVTCNRSLHWLKQAQCGHFATRGHPMTRFDEKNCHAQCSTCNSPDSGKGEQAKHGFAIDRMYGPGTAQQLIDLSEVRGQKELTKMALKELAKEYRLKAKDMAKKRGIVL